MIALILLNGLWQGALIALVAHFCLRLARVTSATTRYGVWFIALLAIVVVPILTIVSKEGALIVAALQPHAGPASRFTISLIPVGTLTDEPVHWIGVVMPWILIVWLAVAIWNLAKLGASHMQIRRTLQNATPVPNLGKDVLISPQLSVPIAAGIFAPAIVIPKTLIQTLSPDDLQRIVDHERAHIERNDITGNLIQRLIEAVLFFNPWVYVVGRRLVQEREAACDDWVVEKNGAADEYAACLATLAHNIQRAHSPLMTPSAFGSRRALLFRIDRLVSGASGNLKLNYYTLGGTIVLFAVMTLALQAMSPAFASTSPAAAQPTLIAAACKNPNAPVSVTNAVVPNIPHGIKARGVVNVLVSIGANGQVETATVRNSSGNAQVDKAVLDAAKASTYSPETAGCKAVAGQYIFHVEFAPN